MLDTHWHDSPIDRFWKEYEVIYENDRGFQTDYILKDVNGHFNSCWFNEVTTPATLPTFIAIARNIPTVGISCNCFKLEFVEGKPKLIPWSTSTVKEIRDLGNKIYKVTTRNSIYIVQVG